MGILDELRKEANEKKQRQESRKIARQQQDAAYLTRVLPAMQNIFNYLQETLEYLRVVDEVVEIPNYSDRYPQLGRLYQCDYKINTDGFSGLADFNRMMQINFQYRAGSGLSAFKKRSLRMEIRKGQGAKTNGHDHHHQKNPGTFPL